MKTITLTQPWASLVATGAKTIETRSWKTSYRGPLAIHAAKGFPGHAKRLCESRLFCRVMGWPECPSSITQDWLNENARRIRSLPIGCVIATCDLVGCNLIVDSLGPCADAARMLPPPEPEFCWGNYDPGRYAWLLSNVRPLAKPVPAKGALSLWDWTPQ